MKQPTLIILKGLPYSGKTIFANEWTSKKTKRIRISWSDTLKMMRKDMYADGAVLSIDCNLRLMRQALRKGYDVILDECNLYAPQFSLFLSSAKKLGAKVEMKNINTSPEECKKRCLADGGDTSMLMWIDRLHEKYGALLR